MIKNSTFTKVERVKRRNDFRKIFANGIFIKSNAYNYLILKNDLSFSRIGIIASKKVGNAVIRNKEKRIVRELFRSNKDKLLQNTDILIFLKKETSSLSFNIKNLDFTKNLKRKDLLHN